MDFDPFNQNVTFQDGAGSALEVPISEIDSFYFYSIQQAIIMSAQLGASALFAVVIVFLTRPERRKTPVFLLNLLCLALNFIRCLLIALYYLSGFSRFYAYFADDYSRVPRSDYATSVTTEVISVLLVATVLSCLVFQVVTICKTFAERWRMVLIALSIVVALTNVAIRITLGVFNSEAILQAVAFSNQYRWVNINEIMTAITICLFSALFSAKLIYSIVKRRRYLHIKTFSNLDVLAIGAGQCMFFPALFSILENRLPFPGSSSLVLTFVSISLPLSSLWASAVTTGPTSYQQDNQHILNSSSLKTKRTSSSTRGNRFSPVSYVSGLAKGIQDKLKSNRSSNSMSTPTEETNKTWTEIQVARETSHDTNEKSEGCV